MNIRTNAVAGTLESSDVYVKVEPSDKLEISIESVVYNQFAQEIEKSIRDVVDELGVTSGKISVNDNGAIDCVIKAPSREQEGNSNEKIYVIYPWQHPKPSDER